MTRSRLDEPGAAAAAINWSARRRGTPQNRAEVGPVQPGAVVDPAHRPRILKEILMPEQTALCQIAEKANQMRPQWSKASLAQLEAELELAAIGPNPDLVRAGALVIIMLERPQS